MLLLNLRPCDHLCAFFSQVAFQGSTTLLCLDRALVGRRRIEVQSGDRRYSEAKAATLALEWGSVLRLVEFQGHLCHVALGAN